MEINVQQGFRLESCTIKPLLGEIQGPGGSGHVQPKAMEVLLRLARAGGEVVDREDLLNSVWGGRHGSDEVLTRSISELRQALGDESGNPRFIQTIPKRGYRLIPSVDTPAAGSTSSSGNSDESVSFWEDLKRRHVFRVAGAYAAVTWLVIEVSETVFPRLGFPEWSVTLLIVAGMLGLPLVLVLAWAFQITPNGIVLDIRPDNNYQGPWSRRADYLIIAALLFIIFALSYRLLSRPEVSQPATEIAAESAIVLPAIAHNSVAVLPFMNIGNDPLNEALGDGLAEELLNLLANVNELRVAARTASFYFKGKAVDVATLGQRLRVKNLVDGSIQRQEDRVVITAQLIDVESGYHNWSQTYEVTLDDMLSVREEIAMSVVDSLSQVLGVTLNADVSAPTEFNDAYVFYIQAREYLRRPKDESTLAHAADLFGEALAIDPRYAQAYAGLCDTHLAAYRLTREIKRFEAAEQACHRALTLDSSLAEVHLALGNLYRRSGQYDEAELEFARAAQLAPRVAEAYIGQGRALQGQKQMAAARLQFEQAIEVDPSYWGAYNALGLYLLQTGKPEESLKYFQHVIRITPDGAPALNNLGAAYASSGHFDDALAAWERSLKIVPNTNTYLNLANLYYYTNDFQASVDYYREATRLAPEDARAWGGLGASSRYVEGGELQAQVAYERSLALGEQRLAINPKDFRTMARMGTYYAQLGERENARLFRARSLELGPEHSEVQFFAALTSIRLGNPDEALGALEASARLGFTKRIIKMDPQLAELRTLPRFVALVNE